MQEPFNPMTNLRLYLQPELTIGSSVEDDVDIRSDHYCVAAIYEDVTTGHYTPQDRTGGRSLHLPSGGRKRYNLAMETDEQYARVISLLERIDRTLCDIKGLLDKYKPLIEKLERRFNPKWGQHRG
jgi:hypothetical protein